MRVLQDCGVFDFPRCIWLHYSSFHLQLSRRHTHPINSNLSIKNKASPPYELNGPWHPADIAWYPSGRRPICRVIYVQRTTYHTNTAAPPFTICG